MHTTVKLQRCFEPGLVSCLCVLVTVRIGNVGEFVVLNQCPVALVAAEQRSGLSLTFDNVVANLDSLEVAICVESKKSILARRGRGASNDVVIADYHIAVGFINPDDPTSWIADQVIVKHCRSFGRSLPESRDKVSPILSHIEVK